MQRADEISPRDADEALMLSYFTLLMQRDLVGFEALWHDDAVQDIPFLPEGFGLPHRQAGLPDRRGACAQPGRGNRQGLREQLRLLLPGS